ncbi:MAG: hypothetical protein MI723_18500, partial [Caulobacterales bacterium]|nr:hypothetical protein [Caulobacterales bacterium]
PLALLAARRSASLRLAGPAHAAGKALAAALIMALAVTAWRGVVADIWPVAAVVATSVGLGAIVYAGVLWLIARDDLAQGWRALAGQLRAA